MESFKDWAIQQHINTNHYYDTDLPYRFHLQMVVAEAKFFSSISDILIEREILTDFDIENACWGHDLIEDCRINYNEIVEKSESREVGNIIYAVTNEKGRNRYERANSKYYQGIVATPGAAFVKICDRLANVKYSVLTNSSMADKYKKEHKEFKEKLFFKGSEPMFDKLEKLFELKF